MGTFGDWKDVQVVAAWSIALRSVAAAAAAAAAAASVHLDEFIVVLERVEGKGGRGIHYLRFQNCKK